MKWSVNGHIHPAGADHRHPARGARQDRRLRRVPLRQQGPTPIRPVRGPASRQASRPSGRRRASSTTTPTTSSTTIIKKELEQEWTPAPTTGRILGFALATSTSKGHDDIFIAPPGQVGLVFPEAGTARSRVRRLHRRRLLQERDERIRLEPRLCPARTAPGDAPARTRRQGRGAVNQIQIKVKPGVDIDELREKLQTGLDGLQPMYFRVSTWEQKQGPLLAAVAVEQSILNILLFFIIAVAGFGILAIFSMIVVEKTRDIGVLKALGASTSGIRHIFLGYGLCWGSSAAASAWSGAAVRPVHQRDREVAEPGSRAARSSTTRSTTSTRSRRWSSPSTVAWIVGGAFIAVAASIWPAAACVEAAAGPGAAVRVRSIAHQRVPSHRRPSFGSRPPYQGRRRRRR